MELLKKYKLSKIVSKDELQPALNQVYINLKTKKAVATNAHILAEVPIDIENGEEAAEASGLISKQAFETIVGKRNVQVKENIINFEDEHDKYKFEIHNDNAFPAYQDIFPKEEPTVRIAIDSTLLHKLAQAMGTKEVILNISGPTKAISVAPLKTGPEETESPRGVIMPIQTAKTIEDAKSEEE